MGVGWVYFGYEVNERTINYIIKYITKRDEDNPEFNGKVFTSKKIGIGYINKNTLRRHRYQDRFTEETYRTESGIKAALPIFYCVYIFFVLFYCFYFNRSFVVVLYLLLFLYNS